MHSKNGFFSIDKIIADQVFVDCRKEGWSIFRLPENISTKDDFFDAVRCTLPLDPPVERNRSWDALADSLWSGLDRLSDRKILIFWPKASSMEKQSPEDFFIITQIFSDIAASLSDPEITAGDVKQILILSVV